MHPTATVRRRAASFGGGRVDGAADRGTLEVAAWGSSGVAREATREVRIRDRQTAYDVLVYSR
jgi:hypothetical protein